ncbi:MAG: endolytic transglycosylase MltG [Bacteroidales bacterium]|nr:endolytic transglycosylase MltG [Bacteroidales bacterium]
MAKKKKIIIPLLLIFAILIAGLFIAYKAYNYAYSPNVTAENETYIYIPTGSNFDNVMEILRSSGKVNDMESFAKVAEYKKYGEKVLPGKYKLENGMSNNELVNMLRSGRQTPVNVTFISVRSLDILAGKVCTNIEADSAEIAKVLKDNATAEKYGFNSRTFCSMFIPNTYEFWWNTSADEFVQRMADEYKKFWNDDRKAKANALGLSQSQVSTLASIVESETQKNDEKARIAGVYINRLKKDWLLQADPTVVFAAGDFSIKRILNKHLEINSPYNTYKYKGLPPGPICIPSTKSIDAVLNYEHHNYMFFCAKEDFSGYHNFATTNAQHEANARRYHDALRKAGIR